MSSPRAAVLFLMWVAGCRTGELPSALDGGAGDLATCASASPDAVHYVDAVQGTDAPERGGAAGPCAYRTLTYALAHARAVISVAAGSYGATQDDEAPFVLNGVQELRCQSQNALLTTTGQYRYGSANPAVVFLTGTRNRISGCTIDGAQQVSSCLLVTSTGAIPGHEIEGNTLTGSNGIVIARETGGVVIRQNTIAGDNTGITLGAHVAAVLDGNAFTLATPAQWNVLCDGDPDPDVIGSGNGKAERAPDCYGCTHCPFE